MISAFVNCFKIPDLRDRILFTLMMLFIARIGANIPLPGINPQPLQDFFAAQSGGDSGNLLGLYNMFTGGALLKGAVFALGIMPYISASIIMQIMGVIMPQIARLQQEGEVGRQKITQYTRYLTLAICIVQGLLLLLTLENPANLFTGYDPTIYGSIVLLDHVWFLVTGIIFLTTGTVILMWIGEQITQRGIGNGISILITVGILADLPGALNLTYRLFTAPVGADAQLSLPEGLIMGLFFFLVLGGIIYLTQGQRKIPVQYAKRVVGRKVYGGQSSFLPLKVNYSGVMPVIFGSAILMGLQQIISWLGAATELRFLVNVGNFFSPNSTWYYIIFGSLIMMMSYVWVSMMFKPIQIADDLKKHGGYIPGVRPGAPTAKFLDFTMTRLTFAGAVGLTIIAIIPSLVSVAKGIPYTVSQFFGGTGMLIIVGVFLDMLRQIETFLLQRHYDGFLRKGRIRGRSAMGRTRQLVDSASMGNIRKIFFWVMGLFVSGFIAWALNASMYE